jgi:hypothetical protein
MFDFNPSFSFLFRYDMLKIRHSMINFLTAIELTPGGSSTVHIYTQTIHRTTQKKQYIVNTKIRKSAVRSPFLRVSP